LDVHGSGVERRAKRKEPRAEGSVSLGIGIAIEIGIDLLIRPVRFRFLPPFDPDRDFDSVLPIPGNPGSQGFQSLEDPIKDSRRDVQMPFVGGPKATFASFPSVSLWDIRFGSLSSDVLPSIPIAISKAQAFDPVLHAFRWGFRAPRSLFDITVTPPLGKPPFLR
jgi:hypothetical protein